MCISVSFFFFFIFLVHYDDSINHSEEASMLNRSIKNMLDPTKERKLIKVDFSALARLVVCFCNY